jgi:hypothetical protein
MTIKLVFYEEIKAPMAGVSYVLKMEKEKEKDQSRPKRNRTQNKKGNGGEVAWKEHA